MKILMIYRPAITSLTSDFSLITPDAAAIFQITKPEVNFGRGILRVTGSCFHWADCTIAKGKDFPAISFFPREN